MAQPSVEPDRPWWADYFQLGCALLWALYFWSVGWWPLTIVLVTLSVAWLPFILRSLTGNRPIGGAIPRHRPDDPDNRD